MTVTSWVSSVCSFQGWPPHYPPLLDRLPQMQMSLSKGNPPATPAFKTKLQLPRPALRTQPPCAPLLTIPRASNGLCPSFACTVLQVTSSSEISLFLPSRVPPSNFQQTVALCGGCAWGLTSHRFLLSSCSTASMFQPFSHITPQQPEECKPRCCMKPLWTVP